MKEEIGQYVVSLYHDVPTEVYEGLLSVLCLGVLVIIACYGFKRGWRKVVGLLLVEYVFVIYCSTVTFRIVAERTEHNFRPFWSYEAIENGRSELLAENVMNVIVFIPIGMILGLLLRAKGPWLVTLAVGTGISVSIEAMQYVFHRGFAETDDVMHNTMGCLIGVGITSVIGKLLKNQYNGK